MATLSRIHAGAAWPTDHTFQDVMAEQIRQAPWYVLSLFFHGLVALILASFSVAQPEQPRQQPMVMERPSPDEEIEEPKEEPIEPDPEEVEQEPVLEEVDIAEDEVEDLSDLEDEVEVDSAFESEGLNDVIGLGGDRGGRFGRRGDGRRKLRKRLPQTLLIIDRGLEWLRNHQDPDGRWSSSDYMKNCPEGDVCDGPGNPIHDVGVTGLATLAFLGDGSTMRSGRHKDVIKKAIIWLKGQMDDDGLIGMDSSHAYMYNHAIAALAIVEAQGLSRYVTLRPYAQSCINYIQRARNPYKVWRYYPRDGENDSSVTGWMVFALKSAKDFGLQVDDDALAYSQAWFEEVTDPSTGHCGYSRKGEPSSRKEHLLERFPHVKTEAMTSVGLLCRIFLGQTTKTHPVLLKAADRMLEKKPTWNETDGSIDLYYWYYGSYAMFQLGGRHWSAWRKALEGALIDTQVDKGHERGSWNPLCTWGEDGGRVYSTALGVLCLEVHYRYTSLIR